MEDHSLFGGSDDGSFVPFTDILFNALLGFAFMVFIAFSLINPEAKSGEIDSNAEFLVTVTWEDNHPDDVDTYVKDPLGNIVWYHSKEAGLMHLDRDDRGNYRDQLTVNGVTFNNPINQETVSIRGIIAGEFVVNVHHFLATTIDPLPVQVKVEKINPSVSIVYYDTVTLSPRAKEVTALRFTVAEDGSVIDVNTRPESLVRETQR